MAAQTPIGCLMATKRRSSQGEGGVAIDPFGLFRKPFHKTGGVGHFTLRFNERFALVLLSSASRDHPRSPTSDHASEVGSRCGLSLTRLASAHIRYSAQDLTSGWVVDLRGCTIVCMAPSSGDKRLLPEQTGILKGKRRIHLRTKILFISSLL
jgi:hypothetical protein